MTAKMWENGYRATMICIDSYDKSVPVGRFYNQFCQDEISFHGTIDLIKKMEAMLDQMNFPQSFSAIRSFAEKPNVNMDGLSKGFHEKGKLATFSIRVIFRQNTSWQGTITWHEKKSEQTFRSVLELILLMDSALNLNTIEGGRKPSLKRNYENEML